MGSSSFHAYYDRVSGPSDIVYVDENGEKQQKKQSKHIVIQERELAYGFAPHSHPFVNELAVRLAERSVPGLQAADTEYVALPGGARRPQLYAPIFSPTRYDPTALVPDPPVDELDFSISGAYSVYNWELFFHVPLTVAIHLSRNGRYREAQRWLHFLFDPTDDSDGPTPERFWRVKPFQETDVQLIEEMLVNLASGADEPLRQQTITAIAAWKDAPFRPHAVARHRPSAYMLKTVMTYLDVLIAWAGTLFREDTRESINEATQLYLLAAGILGPRPQAIPQKGSVRPQTYAALREDLDKFGNALRDVETDIPFDNAPHPTPVADLDRFGAVASVGSALYFCVPRNDRLLAYWDDVGAQLFKIRNSLNFQGTFRQLELFPPPINPALLAGAAAAGVDVGAVVSGANQPLPLVRFEVLVRKAAEICQEVKSLGNALLQAIEKQDNEALANLRARHERAALQLAETVRYQQWQETIKSREGLETSLANAARRYGHYERLLGRQESEIAIPALEALDQAGLEAMRFAAAEPEVAPRPVTVDIANDGLGFGGGAKVSSHEVAELQRLNEAQIAQDVGAGLEAIGAFLNLIPAFSGDVKPIGLGAGLEFGGMNLSGLLSGLAAGSRAVGSRLSYEANKSAKIGGYARREQDWAFQSNLAAGEITQTYKQLRAAQIRESIAERELRNHQQQIRHAEEIERFLIDERAGKRTNQAFYTWMRREIKGLYSQSFDFAFEVARKAERALQHELGDPGLRFLRYGYLAGNEGLLAGDRLYLDIKRMELAFDDLNQREYELSKDVSLLQLDPRALLALRSTGRCTVFLPEELFDMDGPGHYFRRIRSVALSMPSVTGSHTTVACTLTLLKSSIRTSPLLRDGAYAREGAEDDRFSDHFGTLESIVTSRAERDGGLSGGGGGDARAVPFALSGAISEWQLELPGEVRQFDYFSIADLFLHIGYTAREGGGLLRAGAVEHLEERIAQADASGSVRLFAVRSEFSSAWAKFKAADLADDATAPLTLELRPEHYPYWSQERLEAITNAGVFSKGGAAKFSVVANPDGSGAADEVSVDASLAKLRAGALENNALPAPTGEWTLNLTDNTMDDLWLLVAWGAATT